MNWAEGIAKHGFRRWYERQLIEGHMYFVTCFLCMIVVAACLEQIDWHEPVREFASIVYLAGGAVIGAVSIRRYNFLLSRAESLAAQSTCADCRTYGILQVLAAGAELENDAPGDGGDGAWIRVRCKKCGHQWRMDHH